MSRVTVNPVIEESWKNVLAQEFQQDYFANLKTFLIDERSHHTVFPAATNIFNAFNLTPFHSVRIVILGQDPYHGPGQAHGFCFSVPKGIPQPPSLINIFKEINNDLGIAIPSHGNLEKWARQGVLLLNATLTVRSHQAGSHQNKGWEQFTDAAIKTLSEECEHLVFMLWGSYAQAKVKLIDTRKHYVLKAPHPSPLSVYRGFWGCKHFSLANSYLKENGLAEIDWTVE